MMPSCDQIGVPIHFHSSTTSGSASLMSLRILLRVSRRQSPSSSILFEMSSDADCPWLAPDFFMLSSQRSGVLQPTARAHCNAACSFFAASSQNKKIERPQERVGLLRFSHHTVTYGCVPARPPAESRRSVL